MYLCTAIYAKTNKHNIYDKQQTNLSKIYAHVYFSNIGSANLNILLLGE
jgi:hypothetical protein